MNAIGDIIKNAQQCIFAGSSYPTRAAVKGLGGLARTRGVARPGGAEPLRGLPGDSDALLIPGCAGFASFAIAGSPPLRPGSTRRSPGVGPSRGGYAPPKNQSARLPRCFP